MWFMALLFFAYQFILRQWPSLTMTHIMDHFSVNAVDFGIFSGMYYVGYAGFQIPAALLLYKSPRLLMTTCMALSAGSMILMITTQDWWIAVLARSLMGMGSAVGFLGVSHIISVCFKPQYYTRMVALSFTFGLMGAIYGGEPVGLFIKNYGVFETGLIIGGFGIVIAMAAGILIKIKPSHHDSITWASLSFLMRDKKILLLGLGSLLMVGPLEGFADAWGAHFLSLTFNLDKAHAAGIISFIFMGMLFGGPLLAFMSEKWGPFYVIMMCGFVLAVLFSFLLYGHGPMTLVVLKILLLGVGILCCYQVMVFTLIHHMVPKEKLGMAIAFVNAINMLGGTFFHNLIGGCMIMGNYMSTHSAQNSLSFALGVIPLCSLLGVAVILWLKKYNTLENTSS